MAGSKVSIDGMADAIMKELNQYADAASDDVKSAVTKAAKTVKQEIQAGAPVQSGKYKKSWSTKNTAESSSKLEITVYSRNRYQVAHLLEHGHAKRGGGMEQLERDIERCLQNG